MLGGLALIADGTPLSGPSAQRRRLALLALLAVAGDGGMSRDKLLAMLWPESNTERARHALAQLLHILQRDLSRLRLLGSTELRIDPATMTSDLAEFEESLRRGALEQAIGLYPGPFLDGFHLDDAPEFERWVEAERAQLAGRYVGVLESLATDFGRRGDHARAVQEWRRLAALDPLNARVAVALMCALRDAGDRAGGLRHAQIHQELVNQELGAPPDAAVAAMERGLRETAVPVPDSKKREAERRRSTEPDSPPAGADRAHAVAASLVPRRGRRLAIGAVIAVVGLIGVRLALAPPSHPPLDSKRVLVAVFENRTGDSTLSILGQITADHLARGLAAIRLVSEVIDARVERQGTRPSVGAGAAASRDLARRLGAGTVVWGSYYREGAVLRFEGQIIDAATGKLLHAVEPATGSSEEPTVAVELIRQRVMASLAVLFDPASEEWRARNRPPTYEAYRATLAGDDELFRYHYAEALAHYYRAVSFDSTYVGARARIAEVEALAGNCRVVDSVDAGLGPDRTSLPPVDRGHLDWALAHCRGDWLGALEAARIVLEQAPRSYSFVALASVSALEVGRPGEALRILQRLTDPAIELPAQQRAQLLSWESLAEHALGEHEAELRIARAGLAANLRNRRSNLLLEEASALAALGRVDELERRLDTWPVTPPDEVPSTGQMLLAVALELRAHGWSVAAGPVLDRGATWYRSHPAALDGSDDFVNLHGLFALPYYREQWDEALVLYRRLASKDPTNFTARAALGALAARRGDSAETARIDAWLTRRTERPNGPPESGAGLYARARIAALRGDAARAITLLREAFDAGHNRIFLHLDPDFETLRGSPAFEALLRPVE